MKELPAKRPRQDGEANVVDAAAYKEIIEAAEALVDGERDVIANTANISSLVFHELRSRDGPHAKINWVGFYFMKDGGLVLGPFQGRVACIRIKVGRGVCGKAVAEEKTQLVGDVHAVPDHIACDSASESEIVVPVVVDGRVVAVFDLDCAEKNCWGAADQEGLERIAALLATACHWP